MIPVTAETNDLTLTPTNIWCMGSIANFGMTALRRNSADHFQRKTGIQTWPLAGNMP
jgi:hypothetical protein